MPDGKRDEVVLMWLTAGQFLRLLQSGDHIPARLRRRGCLPEAWLLAHILAGAPSELFEEIAAKASIKPEPAGESAKKETATEPPFPHPEKNFSGLISIESTCSSVAVGSTLGGLELSYRIDLPSGATIVMILALLFFMATLWGKRQRA